MTGAQCRAARALLDISQTELASIAKVGANLVRDLEHAKRLPRDSSIRRIRAALVVSGIEFIDDPDGGGAKLRGLSKTTKPLDVDVLAEVEIQQKLEIDQSMAAMPSPAQCRSARGFLKWSQSQAAKALQIGLSTLVDFENGVTIPQPLSLEKIRLGFELRDITFSRDRDVLVTSFKPSKAMPNEGSNRDARRRATPTSRAERAHAASTDRPPARPERSCTHL